MHTIANGEQSRALYRSKSLAGVYANSSGYLWRVPQTDKRRV